VKAKPTVGSPFFRMFSSDRILMVTKDGNVHFFIHIPTFRVELKIIPAYSGNFLKLLRTVSMRWVQTSGVITGILSSDLHSSERDVDIRKL
jgi:hypothetical protein